VLCGDEMAPISAKTYYGRRWSALGQRPYQEVDYGRRAKTWVFGALEPATGQTLTMTADQRTTTHFIDFLDQVVQQWRQGEIILILDNLAIHKTLDVRLWLLAHPQVRFLFQPTYAPWLNLIEPWWKTLRSLALQGRCFENLTQIVEALDRATAYWNAHRHPYLWRKAA
jgi:transposase